MSYLIDTNILSDLKRRLSQPMQWLQSIGDASIFVSVITIGEIERGVVLKRRSDEMAATAYQKWLQEIRRAYAETILPVTEAIALEWGGISAIRTRNVGDGLIAATAMVHGLHLVTRNTRDFEDLPLTLINPWDQA